ncbi:MAG: hypothetical protein HY363_04900 [Candidatus Aenigmarchaeota archaeon]|nr:hypothetical protein [Candidatus Aenigmarchaeota archaeon]
MDAKTLGTIQLVGGILALFSSLSIGMMSMRGMMYSMGGWGVLILATLFIITGVHHLTETHSRH